MVDKHLQGPEFFNQLAPQWDATRNKRPEVLQKLVAKLDLKEQDQVWDLGSGTGVLLPYLAPRVQHVTAVDYADKMLALAREKMAGTPNVTFLVSDVMELEIPKSTTLITCLNFYPHVTDKPAFLQKMFAALPAGGRLAIMHDISRAAVNAIHKDCEQVKEHLLLPAKQEIWNLTAAGFKILAAEDTEEFYFLLGRK
jgi:ubiquinone/menaquinone biosynthesis C-methylase UbiE